MRKFKHIAILGGLGFFLLQAAKATGIEQDFSTQPMPLSDTTIKKDSVAKPVSDPKLGLKNLFQTAKGGEGFSGARLNPMAISFVESYIARNKKGFMAMKEWAKP